jgi:sulfur carrier protein ThiS
LAWYIQWIKGSSDMGNSNDSARRCALALAISLAALLQLPSASAAPISVYGGPTFSDTTGGYLPASTPYGVFALPLPQWVLNFSGAVNNAGIAVGNFDKLSAPISTTEQIASLVSFRWSAASTPAEIASAGSDTQVQVRAINSAGTISGVYATDVVYTVSTNFGSFGRFDGALTDHPARWPNAGATVETLGGLGTGANARGVGYAINDQGTIVGMTTKFDGGSRTDRAVRWEANGTAATELGAFAHSNYAFALSINNSGTAVGFLGETLTSWDPVRWDGGQTAATKLDSLGTQPGSSSSGVAVSVNDSGVAVGYVEKRSSTTNAPLGLHAVRWDAGGTVATELGSLGIDAQGLSQAAALAVNNAGTVIGFDLTSLYGRGVRWDAGSTTAIELKAVSTGGVSVAYAINSSGIIVGAADAPRPDFPPFLGITETHAVYWGNDGAPIDLNSLIEGSSGWTLQRATAISDTGWILGIGQFDPDGFGGQPAYSRMFLMQVPEPSSLAIGCLGVVCAGLTQMRRLRSIAISQHGSAANY